MALELRTTAGAFRLEQTADGLTLDGEPVRARVERVGPSTYLLLVETADGHVESRTVTLEPQAGGRVRATTGGAAVAVEVKDETALLLERFGMDAGAGTAEREVRAPMPGLVVAVLVGPGATVEAGAGLVVLEAMKMENELRAAHGGTVAAVHVAPGDAVGKGDLLVTFE